MHESICGGKILRRMMDNRIFKLRIGFMSSVLSCLLMIVLVNSVGCSKPSKPKHLPEAKFGISPEIVPKKQAPVFTTASGCWHENLSHNFDFETSRTSYFSENYFPDSNFVQVNVSSFAPPPKPRFRMAGPLVLVCGGISGFPKNYNPPLIDIVLRDPAV